MIDFKQETVYSADSTKQKRVPETRCVSQKNTWHLDIAGVKYEENIKICV